MAEGSFVSHVFTSNGALPVVGAIVTVTQRQGGNVTLLGVRTTGRSGLTDRIVIPTPDTATSQAPGDVQPYAVVDITVEHPGYGRITANNVQIFPAITTDQNFMLIPVGMIPDLGDESQEFNTPAQDL